MILSASNMAQTNVVRVTNTNSTIFTGTVVHVPVVKSGLSACMYLSVLIGSREVLNLLSLATLSRRVLVVARSDRKTIPTLAHGVLIREFPSPNSVPNQASSFILSGSPGTFDFSWTCVNYITRVRTL